MTPYAPEEYRAQHLDGCTLDADHAGACRLARPFRIRPEGGREYLDRDEYGTRQDAEQFVREALGEWAAEYDVPALADALHEHAGRSWDMSRVPEETFWAVVKQHERPVAEVLATDHELRVQMRAQRESGAGQEASAPREVDDVHAVVTTPRAPRSAPREVDRAGYPDLKPNEVISAPREVDDVPLLDSTDAAAAEVRWVAREARALMADDDPQRRARFLARKRALLAFIARETGGDER